MIFDSDDEAGGSANRADSVSLSNGADSSPLFHGMRASKRRRLSGRPCSPHITPSSGDSDEYDLPSNNFLDTQKDLAEQRGSKHLMHIPEYGEPHENTFFTQIDPHHSSPSRIRGPRWRKRSPTPNPPVEEPTKVQPPVIQTEQVLEEEFDSFIDDDPDLLEAFLSSPIDQGQQRFLNTKTLADAGGRPRLPLQTQGSFRQTTLFGDVSQQKEVGSSQTQTHNWPLANRNEPLTHHKLNYEALTTWTYPTNLGKTRTYQFNIVQRALCHNVLVALPTGLGKTFIAATVMLNWFRWTQNAQIIFVAPTRPLVSQQVDSCFNVAGIPRSETTMLVGNIQPAIRAEEYKSKRVFFMTPQTLVNDLKSGICDPKRIVLLVVDEAHRAKGGYAYVEVVKFIRRFNQSFRVLALTATPGSTVEAVQEVIDGLDIARVEIRTEHSLDIREFVHGKDIEPVTFDNSDELSMCLELFSSAVKPVMGQLASQNAYWSKDPLSITLFGLKQAQDRWMREAGKNAAQGLKGMVRAVFGALQKLALPLELLKYHGISPFYHKMKAFEEESRTGQSKYAKQIANDEHFKKLMNRIKGWIDKGDFEGHPKLSYLKAVILNHFMDAGEGRGGAGGDSPSNTRIMVFAHWRDSAEEISRVLNRHGPMIRAHVFVGQAASSTSEGMDQKTQQSIIDKFKKGTYNVLVSTSIGEEGLDIGEIDLIVCYDCSKSPIRMLQRIGRTGRKRAGAVKALLMKGKEEGDFEQAKDNYARMQKLIAEGKSFDFCDDRSPRIVPKEIKPVANLCVVEIPTENSQTGLPEPRKRASKSLKKPPKRFNMPDGVETGFKFLGEGKELQKSTRKKQPSETAPDLVIASLPCIEDVLLTPEQEFDLERRYAQVDGPEPVEIIHQPRVSAFPERLSKLDRTAQVAHSAVTRRLVNVHQTIQDPHHNWTRPTKSSIDRTGVDRELSSDDASERNSLGEIFGTRTRKAPDIVDEPFYVSQQVVSDDEGWNDALPDVAALLSIKRGVNLRNGPTGIGLGARKRAQRLVSDDDD